MEHVDRIYDPFFTTKNAPKNGRRGTGLGLAVTYGIIQEHAGKIRVESRLGKGTVFHLEFPPIRKAEAAMAGGDSAEPSAPARAERGVGTGD